MIPNFIWTIAFSSVFPMLILLGMILGIEFANQLYSDNNSRTFDFCLRIIMYLIAFVLMVGFWALFINEFMTVEMKEAFPNFPMNFFIILSSLIVYGTICCILYRIQEKYQIMIKKLLAKIRNHYIKYAMIFFATTGAVVTAVAYITSFVTINTYNLSSELIMPNIGKSIYSIICGILFLTLIIGCPLALLIGKTKKHFLPIKSKIGRFIGEGSIMLIVLMCILCTIYVIASKPFYIFSENCMFILTTIFLSICLVSAILLYILGYKDSIQHKAFQKKLKDILLCCCITSYLLVAGVACMQFTGVIFTPHTKYNEYEYIETQDYGDCVILMRNNTQYILEKFSYDKNSETITIYIDKYYVENINSAEIKKISYKERVLSKENIE